MIGLVQHHFGIDGSLLAIAGGVGYIDDRRLDELVIGSVGVPPVLERDASAPVWDWIGEVG